MELFDDYLFLDHVWPVSEFGTELKFRRAWQVIFSVLWSGWNGVEDRTTSACISQFWCCEVQNLNQNHCAHNTNLWACTASVEKKGPQLSPYVTFVKRWRTLLTGSPHTIKRARNAFA